MKIGNYSIPDLRLFPMIHDSAKIIYENYHFDEANDENAVAVALGHKSANSGAFLSKLADLRNYGLLESRSIKATPLAERLTYGTEEEKQNATNEAIMNVSLWKELYGRFGVELPDSNFWVQLQKITAVSHIEAQKYADFVRKAYLDDISHIKVEKKEQRDKDKLSNDKSDTYVSTISIQAGPFSQNIPLTEEGIKLAKGFLDLLGAQIKEKKEEPKKEG